MADVKSEEEHRWVRKLYRAGGTNRQIMALTGFASATIVRHILSFREYIKCDHSNKMYECKLCRSNNGNRRKSLADLERDARLLPDE